MFCACMCVCVCAQLCVWNILVLVCSSIPAFYSFFTFDLCYWYNVLVFAPIPVVMKWQFVSLFPILYCLFLVGQNYILGWLAEAFNLDYTISAKVNQKYWGGNCWVKCKWKLECNWKDVNDNYQHEDSVFKVALPWTKINKGSFV